MNNNCKSYYFLSFFELLLIRSEGFLGPTETSTYLLLEKATMASEKQGTGLLRCPPSSIESTRNVPEQPS